MLSATPDPNPPIDANASSDPSTPDLNACAGFKHADSTHEEIQHRAHSMWICAGRPENREVADWLAAEAEVLGER